jgi:hypothetical protein
VRHDLAAVYDAEDKPDQAKQFRLGDTGVAKSASLR